jgi:excisionase family DNA binding protein
MTCVAAGSWGLPRKTEPSLIGPRESLGFGVRCDFAPVRRSSSIECRPTISARRIGHRGKQAGPRRHVGMPSENARPRATQASVLAQIMLGRCHSDWRCFAELLANPVNGLIAFVCLFYNKVSIQIQKTEHPSVVYSIKEQMDTVMPKTEVTAAAHEPHHTLATPLPRLAYGIDAAADTLDLSRSRIYEPIAAGEIAACKVGKRTIIQAAELTAFLDRHRVARLSGVRAALSVGEEGE